MSRVPEHCAPTCKQHKRSRCSLCRAAVSFSLTGLFSLSSFYSATELLKEVKKAFLQLSAGDFCVRAFLLFMGFSLPLQSPFPATRKQRAPSKDTKPKVKRSCAKHELAEKTSNRVNHKRWK